MTTLRARLWLGFGGMLLILLVVSTLSVVVLTRYSEILKQLFRENYDSAVYCDAMKDALDRLDAAAQRSAWGVAPVSSQESAEQINRFDDNLRKQLRNVTLPGEKQLSEQLAREWAQYREASNRLESAPSGDRTNVYRANLLPQFQQTKRTAQQVADMNMANMVSVDGQARGALIEVRGAMLALVSIGVLLAAVLVGAVGAMIVSPLRTLSHYAKEIGRGNLDLTVDIQSADEIGQVAEAFNVMALQLRHFRRLDHEKLDRTQKTTQLAIDSLPDAVFLVGPAGVVEMSNRTAREYFGLEPGKSIDDLNLDWLTRLCNTVRNDPKPFDPEGYRSAIQVFDQGRERFLLPHAVPVTGEDGVTIGITVVLVDVTRLRHADELKSGLLSTVSHELRTPLTSIRMALALLTGEKLGTPNGPHKKLLNAAREDSDRLYRIIENLLNIGRIEAGRTNVAPQRISAMEIVAQAEQPLREAFLEKKIRLEVDVPTPAPEVLADPTSIGYALTNLVINALKFTPSEGEVLVRVEVGTMAARFIVADTGPGIPPEYAGRIFDKFFRLPRENAKAGAGLGLTIAKEIVEAHHGIIAFAPNPGGGSEFSFTLPLAQVLTGHPAVA